MTIKNKIFSFALIVLLLAITLASCEKITKTSEADKLSRFKSVEELLKAFEDSKERGRVSFGGIMKKGVMTEATTASAAESLTASGREYSETNIQVKGVDEADIIKTDGNFIYAIAQGNLVIAKAYPADEAEILSETKLDNFNPIELFIHKDGLLVFGSSSY